MKSVILGGFRHTVESPRLHFPEAELWGQSTSARAWQWVLYDWSRWFDVHQVGPRVGYPGIRIQRPDVLNWYALQGPERPIYMVERHPLIRASVPYPREAMEAQFGAGRFGCQLDYMAALALSEGFDRWILYGVGQPYVADPYGAKAEKWFRLHCTFLWWLRLARERGVEIVFDGPNMFHPDLRGSEEPPEEPLPHAYGYDAPVKADQYHAAQAEHYTT